ncbi:MAG: hypothetical protein IJA07_11015 [Agathobacter sp.]|nr:hypothetical protein [Agathobacter sp.]
MRLKYYLRGVGIGIIFATLVMTFSGFVHKYNISDEYIMREARKLGMVMKDELKDKNELWSEDTQGDESEDISSEPESEPQTSVEPETPVEPEIPVEPEVPVEPEAPAESESESEAVEYVTVVIVSGDYARQVAEKVRDAGLIEDAEDFRKYIGKMGYGQSMHPGTYYIPVGSDYEEICQILIVRQY